MELEVLDGTGCCRQQPGCPPSLCHPGARQADMTQAPTGHSVAEHGRMVLIFQSSPENLRAREAWAASVLKDRVPSSGACAWLLLKPVFIPRKGTCAHTRTHMDAHMRAHATRTRTHARAQLPGASRCSGYFYGTFTVCWNFLSISWTLGQPCEVTHTVEPVLYTRNLTPKG